MRKTYYIDEEENVYSLQGFEPDGTFKLRSLMTGMEYPMNPNEVKKIESDQLVIKLLEKNLSISYNLQSEIGKLKETSENERQYKQGLLLGSKIFHNQKLKW